MSKKKKKSNKKKRYVLSPKGCAYFALHKAGFIAGDMYDERVDVFFDEFSRLMKESGYVKE